jgi:hypothetical protein
MAINRYCPGPRCVRVLGTLDCGVAIPLIPERGTDGLVWGLVIGQLDTVGIHIHDRDVQNRLQQLGKGST